MKTVFTKKNELFSLTAKLADDKMKLFIDVEASAEHSCKELTKEQLLAVIQEFSGKAEIHEAVVDDIVKVLRRGEKVLERRIAKGSPPEQGADGKLLLLVKKMTEKGSVKVDSKGFADFRELHLFDNIQTGQAVARIYAPKPGTAGIDALGNPIKATPGKPAKVSVEKSIALAAVPGEDFQIATAQIDGYLEEASGKLAIRPELLIKGDLDLHVGNINFIGAVKVAGDVTAGLSVQARKGIEVMGNVHSAILTSAEGDIKIRGYFFGGEKSKVVGGKNFQATLVQEVNVEVQGEIKIEKEALDSVLRTQTTMLMGRARVIGGRCYVVCGAEALQWGNDAGKRTEIFLGSDVEVRGDFAKLMQQVADHQKAIDLIKIHLGPYALNPARMQVLHAPHREKMEKMYAKLKEVEGGKIKLLAKKKELLEQAKISHVPRVNVLGVLYPGTVLRDGDKMFEAVEEMKGPISIDFNIEAQAFEAGDLKPIECAFEPIVVKEADKHEPGKK
ncbi:MAG: DUF342 domain-containing protein [Deltaproteobacteria bacterium]|nr:DUF342 domain-containing protein [Deltaproteobacteria bacterium]